MRMFDADFAQPRGGEQSAEAAADHTSTSSLQRRALETGRYVRVVEIAREIAFHFAILLVAVGAQALVAFLGRYFVAQRVGIESKARFCSQR